MTEKKEIKNENIKRVTELFGREDGVGGLLKDLKNTIGSMKKVMGSLDEKAKELAKAEVKEEQPAREEKPVIEKKEEQAPVSKEEKSETPVKEESAETARASETEESSAEKAETVQPKAEKTESEKKEEEIKTVKTPAEEPKKEEKKNTVGVVVKRNIFDNPIPKKEYVIRDNRTESEKRASERANGKPREYVAKNDNRPPRAGAGFGKPNGGFGKPTGGAGFGKKTSGGSAPLPEYVAPSSVRKGDAGKKKGSDRGYDDKKQMNKRALLKGQVSVADFDENKTGYRKLRVKKDKKEENKQTIKIEKAVINTDIIPLKTLSEKLGISAIEITKKLFKEGILKTINDSVDYDTAAYIASDLGIELELKMDKTAEDSLAEAFDGKADDEKDLVTRPPVVTVMGHVDHGKTSLLDKIRKTSVASGEAGGITQHIGAYQVTLGGKVITFLDTPGHEAFTAMRMRGAQATDIAIIVVAADDGIMPQTVEAINHAKAAGVEIIVAVNKIDKPEANIDRVKTQLTEHGLVPEEWGGNVMFCPVSAKTGEGIENLLENILTMAEVMDLKANPNRKAKGVVIEAKLDQSRGPVATVLVQNGTLKVTNSIVVGTVVGKVRAMVDDKGRKLNSAGPATPVSIMGLDDVPNAGDILYAVEEGKLTKMVAEERKNKEKEERLKAMQKVTLDDVFNKIAEGQLKVLNILVKADVQGSVEAVKQSLLKLSNDEVRVNVIHAGAGAINESDVMLADSSNAIIIGFNVRPDAKAKAMAEKSKVDIKLYRVIYEAIEDVEKALKGMLAPKFKEIYLGKAEVRDVFNITGVGMVAGCYVTEGKILRASKLRIYRDNVMICEGNVRQLKRFKDDVKEVGVGFECGISIEKFNDIKVGDFIESYQVEQQEQ